MCAMKADTQKERKIDGKVRVTYLIVICHGCHEVCDTHTHTHTHLATDNQCLDTYLSYSIRTCL